MKYYLSKKEELLEKNKEYRIKNSEKISKQRAEYREREEIKEHIKKKNKEYLEKKKIKIKMKRKEDLNFRLIEVYRSKLHRAIKRKSNKYSEYLGCTVNELRSWLESQFSVGLTWDNYGSDWHIDHVIPINSFDHAEIVQQKICFNWKNLKPLPAKENIAKSDKLISRYIIEHYKNVNMYLKEKDFIHEYQGLMETLVWLREKLRYGKNLRDDEIIEIDKMISEMGNSQPSAL